MKYSIFFLSLLVYQNPYCQTCIIATKTRNAVYVGADSRGTPYTYNPVAKETSKDTSSSLCKIYSYGNFNFAVNGVGFPMAMEEGKKACIGMTNFMELINSFVVAFGKRLGDTLEKYRNEKPSVFYSVVPSSKKLARIIFFGTESDSLYLAQVDFYLKTPLNERVEISASGGPTTIVVAGHAEEIKDIVFKEDTWRKGEVETIKKFIEIEAKANKAEVGGDIDIIKVTTKKTTWIQKKQICN